MAVEVHDDHFTQRTKDPVLLLRELGRRGWVLVTKDKHLHSRPAEREEYLQAGLRIFVLTSGSIRAEEAAQAFLEAERAIRSVLEANHGPFICRVTRDGSVKLVVGR